MALKNHARAKNQTVGQQMTDSNGTNPALAVSNGAIHLKWIWRFQVILLPIGACLWCIKSMISTLAFFVGGLLSLSLWFFHVWAVGGMLSASLRRRWLYAVLGASKLVLIVFALRAIIKHFPMEALPFVVGMLLFVAAILIEAARLVLRHFRYDGDG